ncbi:MAG: biotin--[acetyl-CoA-carboxylase] ligase [Burkholderiales bacterium]|jgi:BirA family biotin operon repressor/biotin-[acetyl-CoA-carboxylase] ligase|nr:biotin--[acetyl-CoA-carboxylase] ligase [Burkholderiales bacterium]MCA3214604.1 biotin--[acetyl-CoA-carboxylase] ligase [Burkholderiales bacterium]MCA3226330.1 biotin--[acetyl-CoA-carboxylase] ligase [Burkholderiales bacterium]MCE2646164.1 biotin--[acetyl-CoA-carboxylase] ligase [Burkholderiaceae bacterium]
MSASAAPAGLPAGTATFLAPLQPAVLAAAFAQPGAEVQAVQATGSTNSDLVRRARETAPSAPWLRCALEQTAGRGRLGRRWYAAPGSAFLFSVALPLARETPPVGVTLAVGLALAERLQCLTEALGVVLGPDAWQLKWPNDVLLATPAGRAKLGGVLAELAVDRRGRRSLVVGVGLNLWLDPSARGSIGQAAAALADVLPLAQLAPLRERWLGELAGAVVGAVREVQAQGFMPRQADYMRRFADLNRAVELSEQGSPVAQGRALGVDGEGRLLVEAGGRVRSFASGELTLRAGVVR